MCVVSVIILGGYRAKANCQSSFNLVSHNCLEVKTTEYKGFFPNQMLQQTQPSVTGYILPSVRVLICCSFLVE